MRRVEKYRPKSLTEIVGQEKALVQIERLLQRGIGGRALLFEGPPAPSGRHRMVRMTNETPKEIFRKFPAVAVFSADYVDETAGPHYKRAVRIP